MFMQDHARLTALSAPVVLPRHMPMTQIATGLIAGTLLETCNGWRAVETLGIGDAVQTLDGGLARILGLDRQTLRAGAMASLIKIDGGHYDTCSDLTLLPGQHLLLDTLSDTGVNGAPFAMISAATLLACPGARRQAVCTDIQVITPMFADEEVVYANSGLLLHCPGIADGPGRYPDTSFFPRLDALQARHFLQSRAMLFAA